MKHYEHRQVATWTIMLIGTLAGGIAMCGLLARAARMFGPATLLAGIAVTLTTLVTRVDEHGVTWAFTLGFPAGSIAFEKIEKVEVTRTNFWLEGLGIHLTFRHGWLWNVAGNDGVMIHTRRGNVITLGTDDPQGLYDAISDRLAAVRGDRDANVRSPLQ